MKEQPRVVIGLCGGSASGKSLLAETLLAKFPDNALIVSQDWYYRDNSHLNTAARVSKNYDHPQAINLAAFTADLQRLSQGLAIQPPSYCFNTHTSRPREHSLEAKTVTIVEGLFVFQNSTMRKLYDLKVFIHADSDLRLLRRIIRDVKDRDRSLTSVATQYLRTVKPMHEQHVEPNREHADLIVSPGSLDELQDTAVELAKRIIALL